MAWYCLVSVLLVKCELHSLWIVTFDVFYWYQLLLKHIKRCHTSVAKLSTREKSRGKVLID